MSRAAPLIFGLYLFVLAVACVGAKGSRWHPDWDAVARCETGGNWRMRGPTYSGGVGFYNSTWTLWAGELGLARRYPNAADAPRVVQVRVAEFGWEHGGYWGCLH